MALFKDQTMRPNSVMFATGCVHNERSGPYHSLKQTVRELGHRGYDISVVGTRNRTQPSTPASWPCEVASFQRLGPTSLHFAPSLKNWLHHQPPRWDVISIQSVWLHINQVIASWCIQNSTPFMMTTHGNFNPVALKFSSWKKLLASKTFMADVFHHVHCYQALTQTEYSILRKFGITKPICVVGNGIELPNYNLLPSPDHILSRKLLDRRTCLYLGRLDPIKGIDRLLRAWGKIKPTDDWQLIIAGSGSSAYETQLKKIAGHTHCENIHFVGPVYGDLKSAWIRQADFMVLPSHSEAFPMTVLEGFSFGRPVLLTNQCGLPEAEQVGAAVEVLSTEEHLLEGLAYMLSLSQHDLQRMGQFGFQLVQERYTWPIITKQLEDVYHWLKGYDKQPKCVEIN